MKKIVLACFVAFLATSLLISGCERETVTQAPTSGPSAQKVSSLSNLNSPGKTKENPVPPGTPMRIETLELTVLESGIYRQSAKWSGLVKVRVSIKNLGVTTEYSLSEFDLLAKKGEFYPGTEASPTKILSGSTVFVVLTFLAVTPDDSDASDFLLIWDPFFSAITDKEIFFSAGEIKPQKYDYFFNHD